MVSRNRFVNLVGKGAEELFSDHVRLTTVTGATTVYGMIGPFEVDMDVVEVVCTSQVPVTAGTNTLDVFNGALADSLEIIDQFDPDTLVAATPTEKAVTGNRRLAAGTQITVRLVVASADPTEDIDVRVRLERVINEAEGAVTVGTYE